MSVPPAEMPGGFYFAVRATLSLSGSAAGKGVINHKNDDRSHDRYEHTVDVDAINALCTEHGKQIAAHNRADDAQNERDRRDIVHRAGS